MDNAAAVRELFQALAQFHEPSILLLGVCLVCLRWAPLWAIGGRLMSCGLFGASRSANSRSVEPWLAGSVSPLLNNNIAAHKRDGTRAEQPFVRPSSGGRQALGLKFPANTALAGLAGSDDQSRACRLGIKRGTVTAIEPELCNPNQDQTRFVVKRASASLRVGSHSDLCVACLRTVFARQCRFRTW